MKLRILTLLLVSLMASFSFATEVTFSGTITFGPDDAIEPAVGYPVNLFSPIPEPNGNIIEATVQTNEDGEYAFTVDLDPSALGMIPVIIEIFDFCNGEVHHFEVIVTPDEVGPFDGIDFHVCGDFNPPPPPEDCEAFFFYEQTTDEAPYVVEFTDLSYSSLDAMTWLWEFGDGQTSTEQNPVHEYADLGIYDVTLTIESDTCASTFVFPVEVTEEIGCVCDDVFDPVCVVSPSGNILEFPNDCYAECEGYGPDAFVDCIPDNCGCEAYFGPPVCVVLDDGTELHFLNACYAECEGYGPDQYFYCDGPAGCFANFWINYSDDPNNLSVGFEDTSYSTEGEIITWEWDFGDGASSTEQNPQHEYAEAGIYEVTLTIVTETGCASSTVLHICVGIIEDCICPDVFDPVCVAVGGETIFFPNLCEAECAGYSAEDVVDCDGGPCGCPEYLDPVCVVNENGNIIQFDNICFAACEGYGPDSFVDCENDCNCFLLYDPVCVQLDNGEIIEFSNECFAECEGYGPDDYVDCEAGCPCPDIYDPVCVVNPNGNIIQFDNICFATCAGYGPDSIVDCEDDCNCFLLYDPVCVQLDNGEIIEFSNECFAECEGYGPDSFVDCEVGCPCPDIYDPVCVVNPNGNIIQFDNICFATCAGYGPDSVVDCEDDCNCILIYDPVCVQTPSGNIIEFSNECFAECEGYSPDDYVDCEDGPGGNCHAFFFLEMENPEGLTVHFLDASEVLEGEIESWHWDFGDGGTSGQQNPIHDYIDEGIYEVTLTITTTEGCTSTFVQHICIGGGDVFGGPECQAMFFFEQNADDLTTFVFQDMSIGEPTNWIWDFGDGTSSNEQNPVHTYETPGVYPVTLTISTDDCESTVTMLVFSNDDIFYENQCVALFLPLIVPETNEVFFLNLSSPDATSFEWDFGDGTTSNEYIALHQYPDGGTYEASLTITTADGCTNTFSVTIDLEGENFTGNPSYFSLTNTEDVQDFQKVALYPNPAIDDLIIGFEMETAEDYQLDVFNTNGQLLQSFRVKSVAGTNQHTMNVSNLTSGVYLIRLSTTKATKTMKFIKH